MEVERWQQGDMVTRNESLSPFRSPHQPQHDRNPTRRPEGSSRRDLIGRLGKRDASQRRSKQGQGQDHQQHWKHRKHQQHQQRNGVGEEADGFGRRERDDKRQRRSSIDKLNGIYDDSPGEARTEGPAGVMTIERIMHKCGQSLIKPSVVSAPMDFLTTEAEYVRVWQVGAC